MSDIPPGTNANEAHEKLQGFLYAIDKADGYDARRELWLEAIEDSQFEKDLRREVWEIGNLSEAAKRWLGERGQKTHEVEKLELALSNAMRVAEEARSLAAMMRRNQPNIDDAIIVAEGWNKRQAWVRSRNDNPPPAYSIEPFMPAVIAVEKAIAELTGIDGDDDWYWEMLHEPAEVTVLEPESKLPMRRIVAISRTVAEVREASCDTQPKAGDVKQAPPTE